MKINKLGIIFCLILFICLVLLSSISAFTGNITLVNNSEDLAGGAPQVNITIDEVNSTIDLGPCQDLNCENFVWVETYIKSHILDEVNTTNDQLNFINLLKTANYGMQEDLNKCQKEKNNYKGAAYLLAFASIILIIYITIFKIIKK